MVSYVGSWTNPEEGKEMALEHYDKGADIVFGAAGASGLGVIEAGKEKGLYAIGVDTDQMIFRSGERAVEHTEEYRCSGI